MPLVAYWTTRGCANSRITKMRTNSRNGQLMKVIASCCCFFGQGSSLL